MNFLLPDPRCKYNIVHSLLLPNTILFDFLERKRIYRAIVIGGHHPDS